MDERERQELERRALQAEQWKEQNRNLKPEPTPDMKAKLAEDQRRAYEEHKLEKTIGELKDAFEKKHQALGTPPEELEIRRQKQEERFEQMRGALKEKEQERQRNMDKMLEQQKEYLRDR